MRPRHKAAENLRVGAVLHPGRRHASMRPRHKAAENLPCGRPGVGLRPGFNEAAA